MDPVFLLDEDEIALAPKAEASDANRERSQEAEDDTLEERPACMGGTDASARVMIVMSRLQLSGDDELGIEQPQQHAPGRSLNWLNVQLALDRPDKQSTNIVVLEATSVPITIPSHLKPLHSPHPQDPPPRESSTFIPPHQLSQQEPSSLMKSSIPLSSSAKLWNRDIVLRSTGFLPTNSTEGFLVSRPYGDSSGQLARTPSLSGRSSRRGGQQLSAALLEPLQQMLSEQSESGPLSIPAAIPECPASS